MIIAADDSLIDYALKHALACDNDEEVNFVCNRIGDAVPGMQLAICRYLIQRLEDYLRANEPGYLKGAPLHRLLEKLQNKRKEFSE